MSKKKKKAKSLLPKRIAGVKVPKKVRKGRFGELLASQSGQKLILEALMAGAAVVGAKKAKDNPEVRSFAHDMADKVRHAGDGHHTSDAPATAALAYALGEAARSFADALRRGEPHKGHGGAAAGPEPDWSPAAFEGDDAKKKPASYEAGPT